MSGVVDRRAVRHVADLQAVYRMFDVNGQLLYVGVTGNPATRFRSHAEKRWFPLTTLMTFEWFPDREAADRAEQRAIRNERPKLNLQGMASPRPYAFTRAELVDVLAGLPAGILNAETAADVIIQALETLQEPGEPPLPSPPGLDEDVVAPLGQPSSEPEQREALKLSTMLERGLIPGMDADPKGRNLGLLLKWRNRWKDDWPERRGVEGPAHLYYHDEVVECLLRHRPELQQESAA